MIYKPAFAVSGLLLVFVVQSALAQVPCPPESQPQPQPKPKPPSHEQPPSQKQPPSHEQPPSQKQPPSHEQPPSQEQPPSHEQPPSQKQPPSHEQPPSQGQPPSQEQPPSQGQPPSQEQPPSQGQPPSQEQPPSQGQPPSQEQPPSQGQPPSQEQPPSQGQPQGQPPSQGQPQPQPQPQPKKKEKKVGNLVPISIPFTGARRVGVGHTDFSGSVFAGGGTFAAAGVEGTVTHRLSRNIFLFGQATYNPAAPSRAIGVGGLTTGAIFNSPGESLRHNSYVGVYSNILGFGNTGGDDVSETAFGNLGIIGGLQRPVGDKVSVFAQAEAAQRLYSFANSGQGQAARISGGVSLALSCASGVGLVGDYLVGSNQDSEWGIRGVFNFDFFGTSCGVKRASTSADVVKVTKYVVTLIGANPSANEIIKTGLTPPNAQPEAFRLQSERWTGEKTQVVEKLVFEAVEVDSVPSKILLVRKPISSKVFKEVQQLAADREPMKALEEIRKLLQAEEKDKTFNLEDEAKKIAQEKGMALSSVQKIGYAFDYQNRLLGIVDSDLSQPFVGKPRDVSPSELMLVKDVVREGNGILPSLATGYTTQGTTLGGESIVNGQVFPPKTRIQVPKKTEVIIRDPRTEPGVSVESPQIQWMRIDNK